MGALALQRESGVANYSPINLEKKPSYVTSSVWGEKTDILQDVYAMRHDIVLALSIGSAIVYRESNIAVKFEEFATQVEEDCKHLSSPSQIAMHPSYQKIIGMGEPIIPLLIQKLDESPVMWFWALNAISEVNPVPKAHKGNIKLMIKDWKNWVNSKRYEQRHFY
jgi:hypothetical protein